MAAVVKMPSRQVEKTDESQAAHTREILLVHFAEYKLADEKKDRVLVRIGWSALAIQRHAWWRHYSANGAGGQFRSFDQWLKHDCIGVSRSTVYNAISVAQNLGKFPEATLERIGHAKCVELARVAKHKPQEAAELVKLFSSKPELTREDARRMVANVLAGEHYDSGKYTHLRFSVKKEDAEVIERALAVSQFLEPVEDPDSPTATGVHLVSICQDYLSGEEQIAAVKEIEQQKKANTRFKLKD